MPPDDPVLLHVVIPQLANRGSVPSSSTRQRMVNHGVNRLSSPSTAQGDVASTRRATAMSTNHFERPRTPGTESRVLRAPTCRRGRRPTHHTAISLSAATART